MFMSSHCTIIVYVCKFGTIPKGSIIFHTNSSIDFKKIFEKLLTKDGDSSILQPGELKSVQCKSSKIEVEKQI